MTTGRDIAEAAAPVASPLRHNALKFTERGFVRAQVGVEEDAVVLEITDTGVGIAPEDQEAIFEAFRQSADGVGRRTGGTGLGLYIVRVSCGSSAARCGSGARAERGRRSPSACLGARGGVRSPHPARTGPRESRRARRNAGYAAERRRAIRSSRGGCVAKSFMSLPGLLIFSAASAGWASAGSVMSTLRRRASRASIML